jgi:integrase/recombinase XerD
MKRKFPNLLGIIVRDYFSDHLPQVRGASSHTTHSYRDSIVLLLRFLSARSKRPVAELDLKDLAPPDILEFLSYLERERKNAVATRNVRLSAIHALFRFVASRNPEHLHWRRGFWPSPSSGRRNAPSTTWSEKRLNRF